MTLFLDNFEYFAGAVVFCLVFVILYFAIEAYRRG